jgi:hypothetical protein
MLPLAAVAAAAALLYVTRATLLQVCAIEVIQYPLPTAHECDRNHLMITRGYWQPSQEYKSFEKVADTISGICQSP